MFCFCMNWWSMPGKVSHFLEIRTNENTCLQLRAADYPGSAPVEISVQSLHALLSTMKDVASRSTSADPMS
jgi:hypothetical protein